MALVVTPSLKCCQNCSVMFILVNVVSGKLSSEIRSSEAVHFALQVAAALSSNNYVHFFKLVRSTTYLNACILHRYFAQVRSRALHTIVHAYCARLNTAVVSYWP
jgi:SAC3/GANP family